MKQLPAVLVLVVLVVGLASLADLGFYAPPLGESSPGEETTAPGRLTDRGTAAATVEAKIAAEEGNEPSLADVTSFFSLERDTLACSIIENDMIGISEQETDHLAAEPIPLGETVILCLN